MSKINITINSLSAELAPKDGMTTAQRSAIFIDASENRLRVEKSYTSSADFEKYQIRVKSTDNQHGVTADISLPLNLMFCTT